MQILFILYAFSIIFYGEITVAQTAPENSCQCDKGNASSESQENGETAGEEVEETDPVENETTLNATPSGLLTVQNHCDFPVWIEQQGLDSVSDTVVGPIAPGEEYKYNIPEETALPAVRLWPKSGCSNVGDNCAVGQSSGPCPAGGCSPTVDSKLEISWLYEETGQFWQTWFNLSMVDGYTIPIGVTALDAEGATCIDSHPAGLSVGAEECPTNEDISLDGQFPEFSSVDLRAFNPETQEAIGCFSPCNKLRSPEASGGFNITEDNEQTAMYCCSGIAIDRDICIAGPLKDTKFSTMIHTAYGDQPVYAWAYDDEAGMAQCQGRSEILFTVCQ